MTWLLSEDAALKALLGGITVSDEKNSNRPVQVWYGLPDDEIREKTYPFLSIDLLNVAPELDRQRSGPYKHIVSYVPDGQPVVTDPNTGYAVNQLPPQPFTLSYQITAYARLPRHDRQILASLLSGPLPYQFGAVNVTTDGTVRRLDLTGFVKRDMLESNKRLFRNVFTVNMSSELYLWQLRAIQTVWSSATINIPQYSTAATVTAAQAAVHALAP